jgi:hypothetical protein
VGHLVLAGKEVAGLVALALVHSQAWERFQEEAEERILVRVAGSISEGPPDPVLVPGRSIDLLISVQEASTSRPETESGRVEEV